MRVATDDRNAGTLIDVLLSAAAHWPEQLIVHVRGDGTERTVTHSELRDDALRVAHGLRAARMAPGTPAIVLADGSDDFQSLFWAAVAAGLVPVPLAPDMHRIRAVSALLGQPPVLIDDALAVALGNDLAALPAARVLRLPALRESGGDAAGAEPLHRPAPDDVAFLQFSSGSTGAPRGVRLTHANVLANLEQASRAGATTAEDVLVSWMPYFHDMGLIGTHLTPLAAGLKQVKIGPLAFAKRPALWFEVAARHRATILSAANFALALAVRRVPDEILAALDLGSVRLVVVGAEPISPAVWRAFIDKTRPANLDPRAMQPVYGLAEATLAVTIPPMGEPAVPLTLDRAALSRGVAGPAMAVGDSVELMDLGYPVAGTTVRIVDEAGHAVGDRRVGLVEVCGPQVAPGYHAAPQATAETFAEGWLRTGDLGFLRDGRLCITGRAKDVVFVNGRTFHAADLEQVVAATPDLPAGLAAVVGSPDPDSGADRAVVFVQAIGRGPDAGLLGRVAARVAEALGHDDVRVLRIATRAFPRTTSGKLRRRLLRERYEDGAFVTVPEHRAGHGGRSPATTASRDPGDPPSRKAVEHVIRRIWAQVLQREERDIGLHDRFMAIGGSSLKAMEVLAALEDRFAVTVHPVVLHECATIAALTDHVLSPSATAPVDRPSPIQPPPHPPQSNQVASDQLPSVHQPEPTIDRQAAAIIAVACRFPGADTPEAFWQQVAAGHDSVTEVPGDRWPGPPEVTARWGSFLDDPALFDAEAFGIGEEEAHYTDPHARILLELAHECLERAGYAGPRRRGLRIGVFAAVGESGYPELLHRASDAGVALPSAALVGNLRNLVAARVAQALDLSGPALAVDTACSSALVALHLARRSLADGDCDVAVVGGVNLNLTPTAYRLLSSAQALSPTGRCHAFADRADGFVPGEGGAAVVLARPHEARRRGDTVLALLRGSAVNNDGSSLSLLAPNPLRQQEVIAQAYRDAGVDPDLVSYVECHGTGTAIGDPVEVRSLAHAFPRRDDGRPRWVGSVKTNLGHLLNAAGMPSLVKVLLAVQHRRLPPSLHHSPPSSRFDLAGAGFAVVPECQPWTAPGPLVAGINGFGFGGTNAHVIIEEPAAPAAPAAAGNAATTAGGYTNPAQRHEYPPHVATAHLLTLSARTEPALRAAARNLAAHLREHPDVYEPDVCASASTARDDGPHRLAVVAAGGLADRLAAAATAELPAAVARRPRTVFVFPGQGSQRAGQGQDLYDQEPVFRDVLDTVSAWIGPVRGRPLRDWCLNPAASPAELTRTEIAQPLLVAVGIALARQLEAWGVTPDAVLGHSVGEVAAACVAGLLTAEEAVEFAATRGRLTSDLAAPGAMLAVRADADGDAVRASLAAADGRLWIAAMNGPEQVVLAGTPEAVDGAMAELGRRRVPVRRLSVSHGFHSPLLQPILAPLTTAAEALPVRESAVPLLSSVTARWNPRLDPGYLRAHAVSPVRFGAAVERLVDEGYDTVVEVGPGSTLTGLVRRIGGDRVHAVPALGRGQRPLLATAGALWERGVPLDRTALDAGRSRVAVPTYPFQRRRYWLPEPVAALASATEPAADVPPLHRLVWDVTPLPTEATPARAVWITGPGGPIAEHLAGRLAAAGVPVSRDGLPPDAAAVFVAGPAAGLGTAADLDAAQCTLVGALRELLDGLGQQRPSLFVVTEDVHVTGVGPERPRPIQALVAGFASALVDELPGLALRLVDLSSCDDEGGRLDCLVREIAAPPTAHSEGAGGPVAWRAGRRFTRRPAAEPVPADAPSPLRPGGLYVITGGAGGVGAMLARDLAGRGAPTLVLVGRSPSAPSRLLADLRSLGATAEYRCCDVADSSAVDGLVAGIPRIDGVFHAAGVVRPGTLRSKTDEDIAAVLAPKVRGSYLLAESLGRHGRRPAFVVAVSSVASAVPGLAGGLGDYAAANAFLDAFAAEQRAAGRPFQALNLSALTDTGMAAAHGGLAGTLAHRGVTALSAADALRGLHTALGVDAGQLLLTRLAVPTPAPARGAVETPAPTRPVAVAGEESRVVQELLGRALNRPPADIGGDESFLGMGLDSLTAVDLVKRLEERLSRLLPTTLFFEYQTVGELAAYLRDTESSQAPPADAGRVGDAMVGVDPSFPLAPVQLAFHTTSRLHPTVAAFGYVRQTITGPLDERLLELALDHLMRRHPMLRVRFETNRSVPRQVIGGNGSGWLGVRDLRGTVAELEAELCNHPQDLTRDPPVRAVLARDGAQRAHLILVAHHAAADGYSLHLLCRELWQVYPSLAQGRPPELPAPGAEFREHVTAGRADIASPEAAADRAWWRDNLATFPDRLRLPFDGDPDAPPAPPFATHQVITDPVVTAALRDRAAACGVSLFHLLLAVYTRCLARWSDQHRVAVNVARSRRDARLPGTDTIVAPLADTLPVAVDVDLAEPVAALARRLQLAWLDCERHARVSSVDLARLRPATGDRPRTVSPASFSFARFPTRADDGGAGQVCPVAVTDTAAGTASAATRLGLVGWEIDDTLRFSWNFPTALFHPGTVARLAADHLTALTTAAGVHTDGATAFPGVVERIQAQCRHTPDAPAVDADGDTLSYRDLDRASAALAGRLRAAGVAPGDRVGLLTAPGIDTVVGVIGILKAGAAWVPLDAEHPPARLRDQLTRAEVRLTVRHAATMSEAAALGADLLDIAATPDRPAAEEPVANTDPEDVAYIIFTSGSTGRPKGVPVTHAAMSAYLDWATTTFGYGPGDRLAQTASICFDASVRQLLAPLLVGATVVPVARELTRDPDALLSAIQRQRITVWSSVPTLWERLLGSAEQRARRAGERPDLSALRWVHVGGEALSAGHVRRWFDLFGPGQRITNLYGPTETTINATYHVIDRRPADDVATLPIGRPVAGAVVEVVRPDGQPCAPGEAGELFIGGAGLTVGYLGEADLTAAAFVWRGGQRFYRSGDRVYVNTDGDLEFLGRLDDQAKIRGFRVEPGEIEAVLQRHPDVERAAVLPRRDNTHMRLVAFVQPRAGATPTPAGLRAHVAQCLPEHMVPGRCDIVAELPRTATGKVDRDRLVASAADDRPVATPAPGEGTPPATATERRLAQIWTQLLDVAEVTRESDFFALGGDSISVLEVFALLQETEPALPRPTVIYRHRTLAAVAAVVDATVVDATAVDAPAGASTPASQATDVPASSHAGGHLPSSFPVTATQRGFLLAEALAPQSSGAWLACVRLRGRLDRDAFQRAVDALVERHSMLRTVFPAGARPPVQQELPTTLRLPVEYEAVDGPDQLARRIAEERSRRFEPWAWPLLRLRLLRLRDDEHALLVHAHHLIGDGYSADLLGNELIGLHERMQHGRPPDSPPLRCTFRDYVRLMQRRDDAPPDPQAQAWWREHFAEPYRPPRLRPDGDAEPAAGAFRTITFTLDAASTAALRRLAAGHGTTLHAPVLTAYHRALSDLTGHPDLVVGMAVTGRDHPMRDLARLFGPCVSAVPVRIRTGTTGGFRDFGSDLDQVATTVAAAREHGTDPRHTPRLPGGAPVTAQFFFTFLDFAGLTPPNTGALRADWDDESTFLDPPAAGTDIFLAARPASDGLRITLRGATGAVTAEAFARLGATLRTDLTAAGRPANRRPRAAAPGLDAAIVGYLPAPAQLADLAGPPAAALTREGIRAAIFPQGTPRLLERLDTPLGRSGFVCLPRFADELTGAGGEVLAAEAAHAADLAGGLGARCVSLAGMIPALTGYGYAVARRTQGVAELTTGHAVTAVSVVATTLAALTAARRKLADTTVAFVGLGSIGRSSLELLLARAPQPPAGVVLCDVAGSRQRLWDLAAALRGDGLPENVEVCEADPGAPAAVYRADLIVAATSAATKVIEVARLRPRTIVVDDSFPHCFDPTQALARMRRERDVLIVGGGLLNCGTTTRAPADDLPAMAAAGYGARPHLPDTVASCQLESLLHAAAPGLPPMRGLVDRQSSLAYWAAMDAAGIVAAPLHLLHHYLSGDLAAGTAPSPTST